MPTFTLINLLLQHHHFKAYGTLVYMGTMCVITHLQYIYNTFAADVRTVHRLDLGKNVK